MNRKEFFTLLLVAGIGGMLGGGIVNSLITVPTVKAESQLSTWQKEFLQREEKRQAQRNKHINSLDLVQAEGFVLRDKEGKLRAVLTTEPDGKPYLEMFDEEGHNIARLDPGFLFLNPKNDFFQSASLGPLGLQLNQGDVSIDLSVGDPIELKGGDRSARIFLSDEKNKVKWSAP